MPVIAPHSHGHSRFLLGELTNPVSDDRVGGQHVVEWRELKSAQRQDRDAEVLGVPVYRTKEPEGDLAFEEEFSVFNRV